MANNNLLLNFDGVKVSGDFMTGVIKSDELIANFNESWIPPYQRERVLNKRKIESLKEVFATGGKIDSVKLNLIGEYLKDGRQAVVSGKLRVIDGQQRLWALKDSNVKGINVPVELYLNISEDEEVEMFHQFNRDPSKLTFGDLAKSAHGSFGRSLARSLKDSSLPVKINVNSRTGGINLAVYVGILHMAHRKLFFKTLLAKSAAGKTLLGFLEDSFPEHHVAISQYAVRNILSAAVNIFGSYDGKAYAYSRKFLMSFANVMISNFLNEQGQLVMARGHKAKLKELPKLLSNAEMREMISSGASDAMVYNRIIGFINWKVKGDRLPMLEARLGLPATPEMIAYAKAKEIEAKRKSGTYAASTANLKNQRKSTAAGGVMPRAPMVAKGR